jgi:superfamily I DNA/RNA helicase
MSLGTKVKPSWKLTLELDHCSQALQANPALTIKSDHIRGAHHIPTQSQILLKGLIVETFESKEFDKCLKYMRKSGGRQSKAAQQIHAMLSELGRGDETAIKQLRPTKNGESRIRNCFKYDLTGYCRLVTVQTKNALVLLYCGEHEDTDKWLDKNVGLTIALDGKNNDLKLITRTNSKLTSKTETAFYRPADKASGNILSRIPEPYQDQLFDDLPIPNSVNRLTRGLPVGASSDEIDSSIEKISDQKAKDLIRDVLVYLNSGDIDGAQDRIDLHFGKFKDISENEIDFLSVKDGTSVRRIKIGSDEYQKYIDHVMRSNSFNDWFLFMHPEQQTLVDNNYDGPAKLSGVSGSGKTCIAIRRAIRLVSENPEKSLIFITLNRSLASLISEITDEACPPDVRNRIRVTSFFELCRDLLKEFEPGNDNVYNDVTWKLGEHVDEAFREFYRCALNNNDAEVLIPVHRSLLSAGIESEKYVKDEFDWIRSVTHQGNRDRYLGIERSGRAFPMPRPMREFVISGLSGWERKMSDVGVIDYLGLTSAVSTYFDQISERFDFTIIDEAQDFGTVELDLVRRITKAGTNDIFMCGDLAQHILPKHQNHSEAGIHTHGRSLSIFRNYRNSREILRVAYDFLISHLDEGMMANVDLEILDPELSNRSSPEPLVLRAKNLSEEISYAISLINENSRLHDDNGSERSHSGCIVFCGFTLYEISIFGDDSHIPVLDGSGRFKDGKIFFSDLEQMKGYEFDTVVIINCGDGIIPPMSVPESEHFRIACQIYVAMTRTRDQLILSYNGKPSMWIDNYELHIEAGKWMDFVEVDEDVSIGKPGQLPEVYETEDDEESLRKLTGRQFLYTSFAIGLPTEIQDQLTDVVDGIGLRRGGVRRKWRSIGELYDEMIKTEEHGRAGYFVGPKADGRIKTILEAAFAGKRAVIRKKGTI